jgi:hypothetical protein
MRNIQPAVLSLVLAVIVSFAGWGQVFAEQAPPEEVSGTFAFAAGEFCSFALEYTIDGKHSTLILPRDRYIDIFPGFNVTITNLESATRNQVALNLTGTFHTTQRPDGTAQVMLAGRNLWVFPGGRAVLYIGQFTGVMTADLSSFIQEFEGHGQQLDVCAMIE